MDKLPPIDPTNIPEWKPDERTKKLKAALVKDGLLPPPNDPKSPDPGS